MKYTEAKQVSKVDRTASTVKVRSDGMILVDGVVIGKRIVRGEEVYIQFCDGDRLRSSCRGTRLIEIPIEALGSAIIGVKP